MLLAVSHHRCGKREMPHQAAKFLIVYAIARWRSPESAAAFMRHSLSSSRKHYKTFSTTTRLSVERPSEGSSFLHFPLVNTLQSPFDWNDRIGLQSKFSLQEKGWHVQVEWRQTPYGAGLFALENIQKETRLRRGILNVNLKEFTSIYDIDDFCHSGNATTPQDIEARRQYVKDYLWGFSKFADQDGYPLDAKADLLEDDRRRRFYGMWIPGNGLNHHTQPNTVYRMTNHGIDLVALRDIAKDEELYDDYRRHGQAPPWLKEFAKRYHVTLNFADCNDFVDTKES
jgi:hypothetical protein